MIRKIIAGGQTGADQGALDAAIELGIPHGGWIAKGRKTESGMLDPKYDLKELPTSRYRDRTEKNVFESDGTVIISRGSLTGGSAYTQEMAEKHHRPCLHIDLIQTTEFRAAAAISQWIRENRIEILNVAGPRASHDPFIHRSVSGIISSVVYLHQMGSPSGHLPLSQSPKQAQPKTVAEAIQILIEGLPLKDRALLANMSERELPLLEATLGIYIKASYGLEGKNPELSASCRFVAKSEDSDPDRAAMVIIKELWKALKKTHKLRIIK